MLRGSTNIERRGFKGEGSLEHVVNLCYSEPVTIFDLATMVKDTIAACSGCKTAHEIKIIDTGQPNLFIAEDKELIRVNVKRPNYLGRKN